MRYFVKPDASQRVLLSSGGWLTFPKVGIIGALETDNPSLIRELEILQRKEVGGITELSLPDFEEAKKKAILQASRPRLREEISNRTFRGLQRKSQSVGAAVAEANVEPSAPPIAKYSDLPPFRPGSVSR